MTQGLPEPVNELGKTQVAADFRVAQRFTAAIIRSFSGSAFSRCRRPAGTIFAESRSLPRRLASSREVDPRLANVASRPLGMLRRFMFSMLVRMMAFGVVLDQDQSGGMSRISTLRQ